MAEIVDYSVLIETLKNKALRQDMFTQDSFGHFVKAGILADHNNCDHSFWESGPSFDLPLWFVCRHCKIQFSIMPSPVLNFMRTLYEIDGSKWSKERFLDWWKNF